MLVMVAFHDPSRTLLAPGNDIHYKNIWVKTNQLDHLRKWDSQILITTVTHPSNKIDSETISLGQHNNLVRFRCKFTQLSQIF